MANNCLKTNYKAEVNDINLPLIGEIRIAINEAENPTYGTNSIFVNPLDASHPVTIKSLDGTDCIRIPSSGISSSSPIDADGYTDELEITAYSYIEFANVNAFVVITPKKNLKTFGGVSEGSTKNYSIPDFSQLDYAVNFNALRYKDQGFGIIDASHMPNLNAIDCNNATSPADWGIDIDTLPANTYSALKFDGKKGSKGNVANFINRLLAAGKSLPTTLNFCRTGCSGDFEDIMQVLNTYNKTYLEVGGNPNMNIKGNAAVNNIYLLTNSSGIFTVKKGATTVGVYDAANDTWTS